MTPLKVGNRIVDKRITFRVYTWKGRTVTGSGSWRAVSPGGSRQARSFPSLKPLTTWTREAESSATRTTPVRHIVLYPRYSRVDGTYLEG
jgi:hypothetical protein